MKLYVSRADIDEGTPGDPSSCPVARAVKRAFPDHVVTVGSMALWIGEERYAMGELARRFIRVVDSNSGERPRPTTLWFRRSALAPFDLRFNRFAK